MLQDTVAFYGALFYFWFGGTYRDCPFFKGKDGLQAKVQVYSLALVMWLWNKPHYRNGTFREDMVKNLRNVAIPGTGIPLSIFCYFRISAYLFLLFTYPLICLIAALHAKRKTGTPVGKAYTEQLLTPQDWFSYWRLNCRLASLHAYVTKSADFDMENKWTFLVEGEKKGVPVSPFLKTSGIVCKDKNEEGGMGIYFFKNAACGGDWIIQERLLNDDFVQSLLPENAPLSTFRIITSSSYTMDGGKESCSDASCCIKALSYVFRAGRAGASTDHDCILFDVDGETGVMKKGTTNAHWYKLGLMNIFKCPWLSTHDIETHPDNNKRIEGEKVPDIKSMEKLVVDAHFDLLPDVPMVGWDVALTDQGMCLLEVNLSCNFFRGSFDVDSFISFVDKYFQFCEDEEKERTTNKKKL
mmetsp:Transcript_10483/g.13689  ORF Transcript_10483/g.13689 Transcript_10483/m.13689 type:complete len:412 (+) Transcript_10483:97-1332(+)